MKTISFTLLLILLTSACVEKKSSPETTDKQPDQSSPIGIGEITHIRLNDTLNADMVARGQVIYEQKCVGCHQLGSEKVIGPGWEGLTARRSPEWIMNMATNSEVMTQFDSTAIKMVEDCKVMMPDQDLSIGEARDVLEFMFSMDGHTTE